ncbi:unnamed protein product [Blepharisma stoltei]|uniref:Uncharacterized protein n=1 Tax=Blepharisma stoltei TaxID=1481888 RepID=A0AAU9K5J9_9CILI|nr:unnamed protein product [Blepharisma stoltei]
MEPREIGLCAIFKGAKQTAVFLNQSQEEVKNYKSLVLHQQSDFFVKLKAMISDVAKDIGLRKCAEMINVPECVLKLLIWDPPELKEASPSLVSKSIIKISKRKKSDKKFEKTEHPNQLEQLEQQEQSEDQSQSEFPSESPNHLEQPEQSNKTKSVSDLTFEDIKQKVIEMYHSGGNIRAIQSLYDIPNAGVIHSWGDFLRCKPGITDQLRNIKSSIINLRKQGKSDLEIADLFSVRLFRVSEIAGEYSRSKAFFSSQDIVDEIKNFKEAQNKEESLKRLGASEKMFDRYLEQYEAGNMKFDRVFESDNEGSSYEKLSVVETYYMNKQKSLDKALKSTEAHGELVKKWILTIEEKTKDLYGMKTKEQE